MKKIENISWKIKTTKTNNQKVDMVYNQFRGSSFMSETISV